MSTKITLNAEFIDAIENAKSYIKACNNIKALQESCKTEYAPYNKIISEIDAERKDLMENNDYTLNKAQEHRKEERMNAYNKMNDIIDEYDNKIAPYKREKRAYANAFNSYVELYDAYVLGTMNGTYGATGKFETSTKSGKVTVHQVKKSFNTCVELLLESCAVKLNAKSKNKFTKCIVTWIGANVSDKGVKSMTYSKFMNSLIYAIREYCKLTNQLELFND